jgi:excisionase family DNA binding protein
MTSEGPPLGPAELAQLLGCSRHTVDCAIKDGTIPALRVGRRLFIPRRIAVEMLTNARIPQPTQGGGSERLGS